MGNKQKQTNVNFSKNNSEKLTYGICKLPTTFLGKKLSKGRAVASPLTMGSQGVPSPLSGEKSPGKGGEPSHRLLLL